MQDALIVNWGTKKFTIFIALSIVAQIACFIVGKLVAPQPTTKQNILATACKRDSIIDSNEGEPEKWYYTRGKGGCETVDMFMYDNKIQDQVYQVVYTVPIESYANGNIFQDHSRWQQNLIGFLHMDIMVQSHSEIAHKTPIVMDVKLAYRNRGDPSNAWKPYAASRVERILECSVCNEQKHSNYDCIPIPLFELSSLYHDYYLLNIRFPLINNRADINKILNNMSDLWLTAINQNGGFTKCWVNLQTIFFPIILFTVFWYCRRVYMLSTPPILLQYTLIALGCAMSLLNIPLEYIMIHFEMPVMLLFNDVKQGIFYVVILSFWLVFVGEHLIIKDIDVRSTSKYYWRHLCAVVIGGLSSFIYAISERIAQLRNPFFSHPVKSIGNELASPFITLIEILAGLYLLLLTYMIYKVFINVNIDKTILPGVSPSRQLHYINVIYRFKLLMIITLLCASLTIIEFIIGQMAQGQMKWDEDYDTDSSSTFFISIYGMWNIYTVALLCLYAPSPRKLPTE